MVTAGPANSPNTYCKVMKFRLLRWRVQKRSYPQVFPIGFEHDRTIPVCPQDSTAGAFISAEDFWAGQVEDVPKTHGEGGVRRLDGFEEFPRARCLAPMVGNFQHVGSQVFPRLNQLSLCFPLDVTGKEESVILVGDLQDDGVVIDLKP